MQQTSTKMRTSTQILIAIQNTNNVEKKLEIIQESLISSLKFGEESGRTNITDIFARNYAATVRRGLITPETRKDEFIDKIREETEELGIAVLNSDKMNEREELADIALVCFAMAQHYGIDLIDEMRKKVEYNEQIQD